MSINFELTMFANLEILGKSGVHKYGLTLAIEKKKKKICNSHRAIDGCGVKDVITRREPRQIRLSATGQVE